GQVFLQSLRQQPDRYFLTTNARHHEGLATQQPLNQIDVKEHHFLAIFVDGGREDEVVRMPARSEGDGDATVREIVYHRPLFRDTHRMMQRQSDAARTNLHALSDRRECRAEHRRIRVKSAEILKVSFRRPNSAEVISIGKLRALPNEAILVRRVFRAIVRKEVEAEAQTLLDRFALPIRLFFALLYPRLRVNLRRGLLERRAQTLLLEPQLQQGKLFRRERRETFGDIVHLLKVSHG